MAKIIHYFTFNCIVIILSLIAGCGQVPTTIHENAELTKLQYSKIANNYLKTATLATDNTTRQDYKLLATENSILAEDITQAEIISDSIEITNYLQEAHLNILKAQIALANKQLDIALQYLQNIWTPKQLTKELQIKLYATKADLHLRLGNVMEAAKEHVQLEQLLSTTEEQIAEDKVIWNILSKLTPHDLQEKSHRMYDQIFTGWLNIAYIMKQYDSSPGQMARAIAVWKKQYSMHPANNILPKQQETAQSLNVDDPKRIALLLPLQGQYAATAEIIRDGFLAAHYENCKTINDNTEVHIYDTSNNVTQAYRDAINEEVDFIVGPLIKDDVEKIATISANNIPILALNVMHSVADLHHTNLFQFGLMPEIDITEIAEQVWNDAHRNVLLIVSAGDWGNRLAFQFHHEWKQRGGTILATEKIKPGDDLDKKIRNLLEITIIEQPNNQVKEVALKLNIKPTRRQDVDAIIIATTPELARQIKPLLNFYYAGNISTYANSSIYSGKQSPIQDQDLNDIVFCDLPWLLDNSITSRSIYKNISTLWPDKFAKSARLYAFGIDAYKIAKQLNQLITLQDFGISGMTGILTIDRQQKIQRKLMWAKFHNGIPKLLTTK